MLKSKSRYYYTRLDNNSRGIYNGILSAWEARKPDPSFIANPANTHADIPKIVKYIAFDNPGLFYVDFSRISIVRSGANITTQTNFLYVDRQISDMEKQLKNVISRVLVSCKFNAMEEYDKELALHDYLVKNVSYADEGMNDKTTSVVGALISNSAVCEGYSKAFKLLCDHAGLSCIVVSGMAAPLNEPGAPHSWNIVKLNGVCAHVDVTWDSTTRCDSDTCYDNFNLNDEDAAKDHSWDMSLLPACTSSQNNYFFRNGLCVGNRSEFKKYFAARVKRGEKTIEVRLTGRERTLEQVMSAVRETLLEIRRFGYSTSIRYSQKRGAVLIKLI